MNQRDKKRMELEKSFKDIIENDIVQENIKIIDIQCAGELQDDINLDNNNIFNNIFIVELAKTEKDFSGKDVEKTYKRYYLGTKCIGADIGNNEPVLTDEIKNKDMIKEVIQKSKGKKLEQLEKEQLADALSEYLGKKITTDEIEELQKLDEKEALEKIDEKDKSNNAQLNEKEKQKVKNIQYVQKIRMDKKVDANESLAERLDMRGYTELYVVNSSTLKDTIEGKKNEINNSQYSLVAISADGKAELVNDLFYIDRDSAKTFDNSAMKIEANGILKEDNEDSIQLRRKTNNSVLGMKNEYGNLKMFLYEKDIKNDQNVGIEIETTNMVLNKYVANKNKGIDNPTNIANEAKIHLKQGCNPDNPKDYDGDSTTKTHLDKENINSDDYIPDTQITWSRFASMCGYRGEGAIEKAVEEFYDKKENNLEMDNTTITNEIVEEKEEEYRSENRIIRNGDE